MKKQPDEALKDLEPYRIIPLNAVAQLLGITVRTLIKNYPDKIVTISPRHRGVRVSDIRVIGKKAERAEN